MMQILALTCLFTVILAEPTVYFQEGFGGECFNFCNLSIIEL